jgi:hypothetical protein
MQEVSAHPDNLKGGRSKMKTMMLSVLMLIGLVAMTTSEKTGTLDISGHGERYIMPIKNMSDADTKRLDYLIKQKTHIRIYCIVDELGALNAYKFKELS